MTGWRIGYIAGNKDLVRAISKLQGQSTSCPNSIAQYAASEALGGNQDSVVFMRKKFKERRELILSLLQNIPHVTCVKPQGAFYVFPDFSYYINKNNKDIKTADDLCLYLLSQTGVVAVAGDSFGAPGYIRFSYATNNQTIETAIKLTKKTMLKLSF